MKILTLNCGSSSLKYMLFDAAAGRRLATGVVERVTIGDSFIKHKVLPPDGGAAVTVKRDHECPTHKEAIDLVLNMVTAGEGKVLDDLREITAVAHRVVHGGEELTGSVPVDEHVLDVLRRCISLAPLHNPPNIAGIEAARALLPDCPHIAVFDTAFHYTIPDFAYLYALPYEWYKGMGIRRYGFHGTSHLYVSRRAAALMGKDPKDVNVVTLHIGNGSSACAVRGGVSVDTSMGFTPLEGLVMGTRSGDIDPAIPFHVITEMKVPADELYKRLNKQSGILGLTGKYADRRDVEAGYEAAARRDVAGADEAGSPYRLRMAVEVECYRLRKYLGAYICVLGWADAIVFTAGVGENSPLIRAVTLRGLERRGIILDEERNKTLPRGEEGDITTPASPIRVFVIPTDEERVFVEDAVAILNGTYAPPDRFVYSFQQTTYKRA
jgi:acetate kinase